MHSRSAFILILSLIVIFLGCGSDSGVKKGDRFEVLVELQEAADIQGSTEYSDGFTCTIPKGTVLVAIYSSSSSGFFECKPVVVNANTDDDYILETLVPGVIRNKPGFEDFSLTLSTEYIGTKIKKMK